MPLYRGFIGNYQRNTQQHQDPLLGSYATLPGHDLAPWQNTPETLYDPFQGASQMWGQPGSASYGAYQAGNEARLASQGQGLVRLAQMINMPHAPYFNPGANVPSSNTLAQGPLSAPTPAPPANSGFAPDVQSAMQTIASWQAGGSPQQAFSGQVNPNALTQPPMANQTLFQKNHWLPPGVMANQGAGSITPWTGPMSKPPQAG